jgi:hypothetical protein
MKIIKQNLHKLPFKAKMIVAKLLLFNSKLLMRCFKGFGETYPDDIILFNQLTEMNKELDLWIKTEGRPTTSNPNFLINTLEP